MLALFVLTNGRTSECCGSQLFLDELSYVFPVKFLLVPLVAVTICFKHSASDIVKFY